MTEESVKYDVAVSFLNPDLGLAKDLTDLLRDRMSVFLFTERQADIAGSDGVEALSAVFRKDARLVVVLFRDDWGKTPWTRVEAEAIKSRGLELGWDSLLLIPLEPNPSVPAWVPKSRVWLGYSTYGLAVALPVVERMLEELGGQAKPPSAEDHLRRLAREAVWTKERERVLRVFPGGGPKLG